MTMVIGGRMNTRCNNEYRRVLLVGVMLLGLCPGVNAEEVSWKEYRPRTAEGRLSYDPKSVSAEDGVVDVWSRFEPVADAQIREMKHSVRFDCGRKRMKVVKTITVYRNGRSAELSPQSKFEAIEAGSSSAILFALVCGEKNESPAAPQQPVAPPVAEPVQNIAPATAPTQTSPQEPPALMEKSIQEVQPTAAPAPPAPQEPVVIAPIELLRTDVQTPAQPQQQPSPPAVETPAIAPANLLQ
jgi:hypothetical protein